MVPYVKSINISIIEETFTLRIVLIKSVSTIRFCENYRQVLLLKSKQKTRQFSYLINRICEVRTKGQKRLKSVFTNA